jgi:tRNA-specific 2-thiouridylase
MSVAAIHEKTEALGKIRYSHRGSPCTIEPLPDGRLKCTFETPQRAMTPGQAAVFYEGDHILCGGTIERESEIN